MLEKVLKSLIERTMKIINFEKKKNYTIDKGKV